MFKGFAAGLAIVPMLAAASSAAAADAPTDPAAKKVQAFYDVLLDSMKGGAKLGVQGRYNKLKPAVEAAFNLPAMTQYAVGPDWAKFSDADHKALIDAFERMTVSNYAKNFDSYNGQQFVVSPNVVNRLPDKVVQTEMRPAKGDPVKFNYRMRDAGGGDWKVIDVFLAGFTSQLALRRSEFSDTVTKQGAAGLVKKMNQVTDNTLKG
ncbi:MAG TPA: ABC transporter substrate-binding protein [Rhizomicrobium sp.]|nr:ABC transporter substrate-binding protein [Rhizomicrobium sp.]